MVPYIILDTLTQRLVSRSLRSFTHWGTLADKIQFTNLDSFWLAKTSNKPISLVTGLAVEPKLLTSCYI